MIKNFEDLVVWQKAHKFVINLYKITESLPDGEKYGIISQVRRSALSIPAHIAEGYSKGVKRDFIRFLLVSKGSLGETKYYIRLLLDLNILDKNIYSELNNDIIEINKILHNLILVLSKEDICH